jgi:membrane protein required for colicin V production
MQFAAIDIVFAILILLMALRGLLHGFIEEVFNWAWLVLGLLGAFFFFENGAAYLITKFPQIAEWKYVPQVLAFVIIFLIIFIVVKLLGRLLSDIVSRVRLGGVNKALGFLFGAAEGLVVVVVALFLINHQPLFESASVLADSFFDRIITPLIQQIDLPAAGG